MASCLHSLERQTLHPTQYEILLTGDAVNALPKFSLPCTVRTIPEASSCSWGRADTLGVQASMAERVLFLRPDIVIHPDCLRQHLEIHDAAPDAEFGVLGRVILPDTAQTLAWGHVLEACGLFSTPRYLSNGALYGFEHFAARNLSLPRRSIVAAGMFDDSLGESDGGMEMQELGLRLRQPPVPAVYVQICEVTLQSLPDLNHLCRTSHQRGRDRARIEALHDQEPSFSTVDVQFWSNLPTRLLLRVQALMEQLRPLEKLPAKPNSPSLDASMKESMRTMAKLRTRDLLDLISSLESPLIQELRTDEALPAVLFLARLHELVGFFSAAAASSPVDRSAAMYSPSRGRVLLATNYFWPSVGGTELLVEELGLRLMDAGFAVDVACRHLDTRTFFSRKGIRIHSFRCWGGLDAVTGPDADAYRQLVCSGDYRAVIVLSHPDTWCCSLLRNLPRQKRPRIIMMPSMNADNLATWKSKGELESIHDVLRAADVHVTVSERGGVTAATRQHRRLSCTHRAGHAPWYPLAGHTTVQWCPEFGWRGGRQSGVFPPRSGCVATKIVIAENTWNSRAASPQGMLQQRLYCRSVCQSHAEK
ncbi:MAG: hypothetical protein EOM03_08525 [Clostridia bacterium]|nr:hypothetical protein [Clostridia bacterium]